MGTGSVAAASMLVMLAGACSTAGSITGLADNAGVLGCADFVAWGTVASTKAVQAGLKVTVDVQEWVYPSVGADRVTVIADDPAQQVGAPSWPAGRQRLLIVVSEVAPTQRYTAPDGEQAVKQWRDAGSPRLTKRQCDQA